MLDHDTDPASLAGLEIVDRNGERIGRVRQVYPDGGALGWAGVRGNLIGTTEALVPLDRAQLKDDLITVPTTRVRFLSAPRRTPDSTMDEQERAMLRSFYADAPEPEPAPEPDPAQAPGSEPTSDPAPEPEPESEQERQQEPDAAPQPVRADRHAGTVPADQAVVPADRAEDTAGSATEPEPASTGGSAHAAEAGGPLRAAAEESASSGTGGLEAGIDRSEGRLHVSTEPVPRTRVVLRKVVVTEQRTITVPVRREELRLVREPIEDGAPVSDFVFADLEEEHVLHEERVVVRTEVVPVERIRLVREVLPEQREVTGESWREQIVVDEEPA